MTATGWQRSLVIFKQRTVLRRFISLQRLSWYQILVQFPRLAGRIKVLKVKIVLPLITTYDQTLHRWGKGEILLSIFCILSRARLLWQQAKEGRPEAPFSSNVLPLPWPLPTPHETYNTPCLFWVSLKVSSGRVMVWQPLMSLWEDQTPPPISGSTPTSDRLTIVFFLVHYYKKIYI